MFQVLVRLSGKAIAGNPIKAQSSDANLQAWKCTNSESQTGNRIPSKTTKQHEFKGQSKQLKAKYPRLAGRGKAGSAGWGSVCHLEEYFLVTVWRSFWDACWPSSLAACSMLCGDSRLGGMEGCPGGFGGDGSVCTTGGCPTLWLLWTGQERYGHRGAPLLFKDWYLDSCNTQTWQCLFAQICVSSGK